MLRNGVEIWGRPETLLMPGELSRCVTSTSLNLFKMVLGHLLAGIFPQGLMTGGGLGTEHCTWHKTVLPGPASPPATRGRCSFPEPPQAPSLRAHRSSTCDARSRRGPRVQRWSLPHTGAGRYWLATSPSRVWPAHSRISLLHQDDWVKCRFPDLNQLALNPGARWTAGHFSNTNVGSLPEIT